MRLRSHPFRTAAVLITAVLLIAGCRGESVPETRPNHAVQGAQGVRTVPESSSPVAPALAVPAVGETFAPVIPAPMTAVPGAASVALFYAVPGETYAAQTVRDGWLSADTPVGTAWLHAWYVSPEAAASAAVTPARVTLKPEASLSVYPGGEAAYTASELAERTGAVTAVALRTHGGWYGIVMPLAAWHEDDAVRRPLLLWTEASTIDKSVALTRGLLSPENGLTFTEVMQLSDAMLTPGMDEEEVLRLLGRPDSEEQSLPLNSTGEPLRLGTDLRYGAAGGLLTVTLDESGRLASWRWRLPEGTVPPDRSMPRYSYPYHIGHERPRYAQIPSLAPEWLWRAQGDLAYAYLIGADDEALLVRGDDGGFSGMHDDSSIYALDRSDGRKLWQIDAGFGWADAIVDPGGGEATILTHYDPERKEYIEQLRRVRLHSGETVWSDTPDEQGRLVQAGDVVVHATEMFGEKAGRLTARGAKDGRLLWERDIETSYTMLNRGADDRYFLVRTGEVLEALEPRTGQAVWRITGSPVSEELQPFESSFLDASAGRTADGSRWIQLGSDRLLLQIGSGKTLARYPIQAGEHVTAVGGGKLLIQRALDASRYWDAKQFEAVLYDPAAERELWKLDTEAPAMTAAAASSAADADRLYVLLHGVPAALDLRDGTVIWQMQAAPDEAGSGLPLWVIHPAAIGDTLLLPVGSDLLAVNPADGALRYRLHNTRFGLPDRPEDDLMSQFFLREEGGMLYIGSANGQVSKLRLPDRSTP